MGVSSTGSGTVSLNSWTLVFSDPQLEHEFRLHQRRLWGSTELGRLKLNLLAGVINLSITTYLLSLVGVCHLKSHTYSAYVSSWAVPSIAHQPRCSDLFFSSEPTRWTCMHGLLCCDDPAAFGVNLTCCC